jgi:hypothetical protein
MEVRTQATSLERQLRGGAYQVSPLSLCVCVCVRGGWWHLNWGGRLMVMAGAEQVEWCHV